MSGTGSRSTGRRGGGQLAYDPETHSFALNFAWDAYRIAAPYFYPGSYSEALEGFRRIAQEDGTPWRTISRYVVLRTMLLMKADAFQSEARSVLSDLALAALHGITKNLLRRVGIQARNEDYFRELGRLVSSKRQGDPNAHTSRRIVHRPMRVCFAIRM